MILRRVDLPQPLGPTRQTNSPSLILREMSSRALTRAATGAELLRDMLDGKLRGRDGLQLFT